MPLLFAVAQHNRLEMLIFVVEQANCDFSAERWCCRADEVKHMSFVCEEKEKKCVPQLCGHSFDSSVSPQCAVQPTVC